MQWPPVPVAEDVLREVDIAPDVIVADFQLDQEALGTNAIADLRAVHGMVPACLVTANHAPDLQDICDNLGVTLFHKPISPDELRGFMETVLPS